MSPDTDFYYRLFRAIVHSRPSHKVTPTTFISKGRNLPCPTGTLVLAEPVTHPLAVFGEIALAPVTVCRCSRPQYRAGFILVADTPVTVAYALLVKIAKPLLRFVEVVRTSARCVTSTEFRHEYRQSLCHAVFYI